MKLHLLAAAAVASMTVVAAMPAAASLDISIPTDNYIAYGGIDWAWAGPCAPFAGSSCNLEGDTLTAFQAGEGWRIPTLVEFTARPEVSDFGGKCASAYFGSGYGHCDFGDPDVPGGAVPGVKPVGYLYDYGYNITSNGSDSVAETWFVRNGGGAVPEPATWAMMIIGFGAAGSMIRRRKAVVA